MHVLYLHYSGELVGKFFADESLKFNFEYSDKWMNNENIFPVSISMPLSSKKHLHPTPTNFLENLIPEEGIRDALARANSLEPTTPYQFLKEFGQDISGAFQIFTSESEQNEYKEKKVQIPFDFLEKAIAAGKNLYTVISGKYEAKFSLAGAQDKFCVIYEKTKLFVSPTGAPSTHIAKINLDFRNSQTVYNEYFCMKLAQKCQLPVPKVEVIHVPSPILLVERYDRNKTHNELVRLHQEDFCQAQGIPSGKKYESRGGPSLAQNYNLIKANSSRPLQDLELFLRWIAFNLLIGNNDSHSKNLSFLYEGNTVRLSPFYDLLSTSVYGNRFDQNFAFGINGKNKWDKLRAKDIDAFETALGIKPGLIKTTFGKVANLVAKNIESVEKDLNNISPKNTIGNRISKEFKKRIEHFRSHSKLF